MIIFKWCSQRGPVWGCRILWQCDRCLPKAEGADSGQFFGIQAKREGSDGGLLNQQQREEFEEALRPISSLGEIREGALRAARERNPISRATAAEFLGYLGTGVLNRSPLSMWLHSQGKSKRGQ